MKKYRKQKVKVWNSSEIFCTYESKRLNLCKLNLSDFWNTEMQYPHTITCYGNENWNNNRRQTPFMISVVSWIYFIQKLKIAHDKLLQLRAIMCACFSCTSFFQTFRTKPGTLSSCFCSTPEYMAPELILPREGYNFKCDIWSLGVTAYTLMAGVLPVSVSKRGGILMHLITDIS